MKATITEAGLLDDCLRQLGPQHPITQDAAFAYASALRWAGRHAEALPLAEQSLAERIERHGSEYPITLAARSLVSQILAALGQHQAAAEHMRQVVGGRRRSLGPTHPWTVFVAERLAEYNDQGRPRDGG